MLRIAVMLCVASVLGGCQEAYFSASYMPLYALDYTDNDRDFSDGHAVSIAAADLGFLGGEFSFARMEDEDEQDVDVWSLGLRADPMPEGRRWGRHLETATGFGAYLRVVDAEHSHAVIGLGPEFFASVALAFGGDGSGEWPGNPKFRIGLQLRGGGWVGWDGDDAVAGYVGAVSVFLSYGSPMILGPDRGYGQE